MGENIVAVSEKTFLQCVFKNKMNYCSFVVFVQRTKVEVGYSRAKSENSVLLSQSALEKEIEGLF